MDMHKNLLLNNDKEQIAAYLHGAGSEITFFPFFFQDISQILHIKIIRTVQYFLFLIKFQNHITGNIGKGMGIFSGCIVVCCIASHYVISYLAHL